METRNKLLLAMSGSDRALLEPHLRPVTLDLRHVMEMPGEPIEEVYFPETAIGSVVAVGQANHRIEIGLIGFEGVSGSAIVLGTDRSPYHTAVQVPGIGLCLPAQQFRAAVEASASLRALLLAYCNTFAIQTAYTALANGRQKLEGRLSRWLLMTHDRCEGNELPLTHEFIAVMLGVRRPGVTLAIHSLEHLGLIRASRSKIQIVDRTGLEQSAEGFYGVPEEEYRRLIG